MKKLPEQYISLEIENKLQNYWEEKKLYSWDNSLPREENFVIDTPPPTVSGLLHMGHIFSYSQADFVARYQRMKGKNVFYPIGFDDNGLPTERLVEKTKNIRANQIKREEFIDICNEVVNEAEKEFKALFKAAAFSFDWDYEYSTISKQSRKLSQMSFLDLFEKKHAYRKMEPCLWDPVDQTALAQAEIVDQEFDSFMNNVIFKTEDGVDITIATTRPELIAACVAVFYHPDDFRYQHLQNKNAITALFGVEVPILADEKVDMKKGTGLVMCCTFGDIVDVDWWQKHSLSTRVIINKIGRIYNISNIGDDGWPCVNVDQAKKYAKEIEGLKIKEARTKMIQMLDDGGFLREQIPIKHSVKCAERSGAPLEIIISPQWFVKILEFKDKLLEKSSQCNFYPEYMKVRLDNWINGLNWDWCISRQRFFGVPFPVWYSKKAGEEGKIILAHKDDLPVNPIKDLPRGYSTEEVEPDYDVMDTWATSSVSPQLTSLAINQNYAIDYDRHQKLFPADLRPQAHEIIRTWAFYTLLKAHLHEDKIPWKNLMISGWCLASDKTKMSKSKGNVVTPVGLLQEKSSDVVRYWASTSRLGADTAYSEDVMKIGKKLVNKIWNASKFSSIHLEKIKDKPESAASLIKQNVIFEKIDLWLISKLSKVIKKASAEFDRFEYCSARVAIEDFFWKIFCDNYLEIVKVRIYNANEKNEKAQLSAIYTTYFALEAVLKLFAPFLPHITEEIYQHLFADRLAEKGSIHQRGMWLNSQEYLEDEPAEILGSRTVEILDIVRKYKAERELSIKSPIEEIKIKVLEEDTLDLNPILEDLKNVTNSCKIIILNQDESLKDYYALTEDKKIKINILV